MLVAQISNMYHDSMQNDCWLKKRIEIDFSIDKWQATFYLLRWFWKLKYSQIDAIIVLSLILKML